MGEALTLYTLVGDRHRVLLFYIDFNWIKHGFVRNKCFAETSTEYVSGSIDVGV
jgi:hypothetical protein